MLYDLENWDEPDLSQTKMWFIIDSARRYEACKFHGYTPEQFAQERLKFVIDTHNRSCNCESPFFTTVAESRIGTFDHVSSIHHFCLEKVLQHRVIVN